MTTMTSEERDIIRLTGESYYLLEGFSEIETTKHIEDMLNAISIQYIPVKNTSYYSCNYVDEYTDIESTFNILCKYGKVYIQRTDHEFTEFRKALIKISEYLKELGIEMNNVHQLNVFSQNEMADTVTNAAKDYYEHELEYSSNIVKTQDKTVAYRAAYDMLYYMGRISLNPSPPYFTDECPYLKCIIELVYNKDSLEINHNIELTYVSQIVKSLKFIYKVAHVTYTPQEWFLQFVPYISSHMNSDKQHIQRTALMVAVFLKNTKGINLFKEIKLKVKLVSKDAASIKYLEEL